MVDVSIKVCFIGLGSIGRRHLKNLFAVARARELSLRVDALRHARAELPEDVAPLIDRQFCDIAELGTYDWAFVCNPSQNHFDTLMRMRNRASFFFVEKPVFVSPLSSADLECFGDAARYYVACPLRHKVTYRKMREFVRSHKVIGARAICSSYLPDWRPGVDYRALYSAQRESGGVKLDLIHEFDYLIDLFGFPSSSSLTEAKVSSLEIASNDVVSFVGVYPDKLVELHLDYFGKTSRRKIELWTPEEAVEFDFLQDSEERNAAYVREMECFVDMALGRVANINDLYHANKILDFLMNRSSGGYENAER